MSQAAGGGGDSAPSESDYVDDGSIQWGDLVSASAGAFLTGFVIFVADAFNFAVSGVLAYVDSAFQGLAGFLSAPFTTGESEVVRAFEVGAASLESTGPFAFPLAVVLSVTSVSLVIWGVYRVAGE
ncbi:hypothetical protein U4E84_09605 [Halorubrum sp. AD140]|uniref:hypothetical protein n=1 Tax=Halorubrum sp. AD140 TaxID=3050073 RepID=UPI002ACCF39D|nr:hypothetical protein [Halorubrum sp. AD140]MDZ5811598.1 hypothetical protein [Halorubrum sp. AD140]